MAFNLATTELSSIFMDSSEALGRESLNSKFRTLLKNDVIINQLFSNSIGIWQCYWYYDSSIKGYSLGDAVWLNTEDPLTFLRTHSAIIKEYTKLNSQILNKLPDFDSRDESVIAQYMNALSGYRDVSLGKDVVLPPIFDIGDFSKPIQLAVSLKDNNKGLLSDKDCWKMLFVDSDADEENIRHIIDQKESFTINEHLLKYHLSGYESAANKQLSNYVDTPVSAPGYTSFPSSWYSKYDENSNKNHGMDYVVYSIRKPYLLSGSVSQYQAVRYWKSGLMEHFGTIATDNEMFISDSKEELVVPFNWAIANDASGAKAYESGELARTLNSILSALETDDKMIAPKDNLINVLFEKTNVSIAGSTKAKIFKDSNYIVSLGAIYQTQEGIEENYLPISYSKENLVQKWNSNYLSNELLRKNRYCFAMQRNTRVLPPYISYYAIGRGDF